ncbi:glycosyltransferase [Gammaproteobacteria bacterium LSUCC0112]|nr:glycosyltransferase [Gammaproteobacteria bacterium LSUCC0112]
MKKIMIFVNSYVARQGNIGFRTEKILNHIHSIKSDCKVTCFCRGYDLNHTGVRYVSLGILGYFQRFLNAFRIYVAPNFNVRVIDIKLFEWYCLLRLWFEPDSDQKFVAHVWEYCPSLIKRLKSLGGYVVLDVPIAPSTFSERIRKSKGVDFLNVYNTLVELELESFHLADLIISPSKFVKQELVYAGIDHNKIMIVNFGVDSILSDLKIAESKDSTEVEGINFCFFGLVNKRKGIHDLLQVWDSLDFDSDRLHLCGRVYPEIINEIRVLKDKGVSNIITPGFVNPQSYMKMCDVFVFPSWMEGSSKAIFEAMSMGLPCIVTESSGSVVRDGIDGFVIDAGDTKALREKMLWFKSNRYQITLMGDSARENVRSFTWEVYARNVIKLYGFD